VTPPGEPFIQPPRGGETYAVLGHRLTFLATGEQTGGVYAVIHAEIPPGDPGPPPHTHTREDEHFYVLEGNITFAVGEESHEAAPGSFIIAPRGIRHTFRNPAKTQARMLVMITPSGFENFFRKVGRRWTGKPHMPPPPTEADIQKVLTAAPDFGLEIHP
jgi:quercetin dioxygenase-like cupin family protein